MTKAGFAHRSAIEGAIFAEGPAGEPQPPPDPGLSPLQRHAAELCERQSARAERVLTRRTKYLPSLSRWLDLVRHALGLPARRPG